MLQRQQIGAIVMGGVFDKGTTLIYPDSLGNADSDGLNKEVLDCHHDFTQRVMESSESTIEIVYGLDVRKIL